VGLPPQPSGKRGRPKADGASKCDKCTRQRKGCGPECPDWPGASSVAPIAAPGAAASDGPVAADEATLVGLDGHGAQTPSSVGHVQAPSSSGAHETTPADVPGTSAAEGGSSAAASAELTKRERRPRDLDAEAPDYAERRNFASAKRRTVFKDGAPPEGGPVGEPAVGKPEASSRGMSEEELDLEWALAASLGQQADKGRQQAGEGEDEGEEASRRRALGASAGAAASGTSSARSRTCASAMASRASMAIGRACPTTATSIRYRGTCLAHARLSHATRHSLTHASHTLRATHSRTPLAHTRVLCGAARAGVPVHAGQDGP
jgi:hypothetical protein